MKLTKYKQEISSITKMEDCIGSNIPSLARIKKEAGEEDTIRILSKKIKQVNQFFNFKTKMSHEQMWITAKLIIKEHFNLNIGDMKLIFENMLTLKYGDYYGKLDGGDFLKACKMYSEDRMEVAETSSIINHSQTKQHGNR